MQPTVFGDVGDGMDISKEEVSIKYQQIVE